MKKERMYKVLQAMKKDDKFVGFVSSKELIILYEDFNDGKMERYGISSIRNKLAKEECEKSLIKELKWWTRRGYKVMGNKIWTHS